MRVARTVAFLDLCGFTGFTETRGDGAAVAVLARLRAVLRAVSEQRGVRVTKWLGDGAMLSGVDPFGVVACAVDVRDRLACSSPLPLRGGIAHGRVIMFEGDDYVGAPVNRAARLCRAAPANVLLAASDTMRELPSDLVVTAAHRNLHLDGVDGPGFSALEVRAVLDGALTAATAVST
jgi:class 3 adenylate cyclase